MAFFLRKIKKNKWREKEGIPDNDVRSDLLSDCNTMDEKLSFWEIEDDRQNLNDVVMGIALSGDNVPTLDYLIIEKDIFELFVREIGLSLDRSAGKTPVTSINSYHIDVTSLTGLRLVQLCNFLLKRVSKSNIRKPTILEEIRKAFTTGTIDVSALSQNMKASLVSKGIISL